MSVLPRARGNRPGATLIVALLFITMFSALAAAIAGLSGVNVQIGSNQRKLDNSRACAESGLEVTRYWLNKVAFSGTTPTSQRFTTLGTTLQSELNAFEITNIVPVCTGTTISMSNVALNSSQGQSFSAALTKIDDTNVRLDVTGQYRSTNRTVRSYCAFGTRAHNVFDYGLASKGPMHLSGNLDVVGLNKLAVEANAFIQAPSDTVALILEGRSMVGGTVTVQSETSSVDIRGNQAGIGGLKGANAYSKVEVDPSTIEFPPMRPDLYEPYAINVLTPTTTITGAVTLDNIRIPAGMNPTFSGGVTLRGVVYIESPNVVTFGGGTTIKGIIAAAGDPTYDPDPNSPTVPQLVFGANVNSYPVDQLPTDESQFAGLHSQTGTFILAPGFRVEFTGTFGVLSGAIGANGIKVSGGSGGTVNGSIINYANTKMRMQGNGDLVFNRSGLEEVPAGFVPQTILNYDPGSYAEVTL